MSAVTENPASRTVELYASGPGLILHSPSAGAVFEPGIDYSNDLKPGAGAVGEALASGRVVLLSTGSPGLEYTLVFVAAGSPTVLREEPLARAQFSLVVTDGCLFVRDGYITTRWGDQDYATEKVELPNGFYVVDARWMPSGRHAHMVIYLVLGRTEDPPKDCAGRVDLEFVAS